MTSQTLSVSDRERNVSGLVVQGNRHKIEDISIEGPQRTPTGFIPRLGYTKERNLLSLSPGSKRRVEYLKDALG
jgi:outer membrane protein assembly factor BamA